MSIVFTTHTDPAVAGCGTSRFEGEGGDVFALAGRGVKAVDVFAAGVVEVVFFRRGNVVSKLPVAV
jgi:hypothetical protein